jgi:hypothetical protein
MELNQQVATLQDEVKLLKGEIKAILKEVRAALLNRDNPFAADAPPVFRPVQRSSEPEPDAGPDTFEAQSPVVASAEAPSAIAESPAPAPIPLPVAQQPAQAAPQPAADAEPPRWNLLTVASLTAWAEDALQTLGRKRFQVVLELACFAELLTPDVRSVLAGLGELMPEEQDREERPLHVNESLVVLRQLEAILQGEKVTKLPRRRGARRVR